jgi:hypothetical protein
MLLNDMDHPMMEKKAEANPSHPKSTEPVCRLKQKNPSSVIECGIAFKFLSPLYNKQSSRFSKQKRRHIAHILNEIRVIHGCLLQGMWLRLQLNLENVLRSGAKL